MKPRRLAPARRPDHGVWLACSLFIAAASLALILPDPVHADRAPGKKVILVTLDGVRSQEIFGGLDEAIALHDAQKEYSEVSEVRQRYPGNTPEQRRASLLPFLWTELAPQGVVLGNARYDNHMRVQNRVLWSSPGYVEIMTGAPRPEVVDNEGGRYPTPTAMEIAAKELGLGFLEVAQIGSWTGYSTAAASRDAAFLMVGTWDDVPAPGSSPELDRLSTLRREIMGLWSDSSNDALSFRMALAYLKLHQPRVMWISLVNSDDWAHADRYDRYLDYLHQADQWLAELWQALQSMDAYRGQTTLVITTDHGRGLEGGDWSEHDIAIPGSEAIWLAAAGPEIPPLGEIRQAGVTYQGQIAATLLRSLDLDSSALGEEALNPIDWKLLQTDTNRP